MAMTDDRNDDGLEALFAAARARDDRPPGALVARVLAEAEAAQPSRGGFAGLIRALGGWPSAAGLVAASAAGVLIGFSAPDAVSVFGTAAVDSAYDLTDLVPGYGTPMAFDG